MHPGGRRHRFRKRHERTKRVFENCVRRVPVSGTPNSKLGMNSIAILDVPPVAIRLAHTCTIGLSFVLIR